jgi:hypothetical protein
MRSSRIEIKLAEGGVRGWRSVSHVCNGDGWLDLTTSSHRKTQQGFGCIKPVTFQCREQSEFKAEGPIVNVAVNQRDQGDLQSGFETLIGDPVSGDLRQSCRIRTLPCVATQFNWLESKPSNSWISPGLWYIRPPKRPTRSNNWDPHRGITGLLIGGRSDAEL